MSWLPGAAHVDLTGFRGNGPFHMFLGVVLHVNVDENGTSDSFYSAGTSINPASVTPNFQVQRSEAAGGIRQYLPLNWQPWTQITGNYNYASIETAGMPNEALTDYQIAACGKIVAAYHREMGMPLVLAESPGERGFGTHAMGGQAWGGHPCPGTIRSAQRGAILQAAAGNQPVVEPPKDWTDMATQAEVEAACHAACVKAIHEQVHPLFHDRWGVTRLLRTFIASNGSPSEYVEKKK